MLKANCKKLSFSILGKLKHNIKKQSKSLKLDKQIGLAQNPENKLMINLLLLKKNLSRKNQKASIKKAQITNRTTMTKKITNNNFSKPLQNKKHLRKK